MNVTAINQTLLHRLYNAVTLIQTTFLVCYVYCEIDCCAWFLFNTHAHLCMFLIVLLGSIVVQTGYVSVIVTHTVWNVAECDLNTI